MRAMVDTAHGPRDVTKPGWNRAAVEVEIFDGGHAGQFTVHAADCQHHEPYVAWPVIEAATRREVVHHIYPPTNFGYDDSDASTYFDDVHFAPCLDGLK